MSGTTHPDFNQSTEAKEVAARFSDMVRGKIVVITGVNPKGIGFAAAEAFASQSPAHMIVAGRTASKLEESIRIIKSQYPNVIYHALVMDLSDHHSVRAAAAQLLGWADVPSINYVLNSAGVFSLPERTLTKDGIETHFATNHVGHFLFTCLIMPKLFEARKAGGDQPVRIINVSSGSPYASNGMRWSDMAFEKMNKTLPEQEQPNYEWLEFWGYKQARDQAYVPIEGYNQSKVANVLFSVALTDKLFKKHGILSLAIHPGVIETELGRDVEAGIHEAVAYMKRLNSFTYKTLGAGAATGLVAALDPKLTAPVSGVDSNGENFGIFLDDCQLSGRVLLRNRSSGEAAKLWKLSEALIGEDFDW